MCSTGNEPSCTRLKGSDGEPYPDYRVFLVGCVERYQEGGDACGRLYNCCQDGVYAFTGYHHLISLINSLLEMDECPAIAEGMDQVAQSMTLLEPIDPEWRHDLPEEAWREKILYWFFIYGSQSHDKACQGELVLPGVKKRLFFRNPAELLLLFKEFGAAYIYMEMM